MKNFITQLPSIKEKLTAWWNHEDQEHPCIIDTALKENHPPIEDTDDLEKFWMDLDFRMQRTMQLIDHSNYYGQAVPYHYVDFGSSAMACILGAKHEYVDKETIWAHPKFSSIDEVIDIQLDRSNIFYQKVIEATKRSAALAKDHHFVAPYALGGVCDNLAGLYGTENLLIDLALQADKVKQALENQKRIWIHAFEEIQSIIAKSKNDGGIGWAGIWSPGTTFPIQEDFSYMISPEMFKEFCLPHICDMMDAMDFPFYHLDGVGSIPHLDALLELDNLKAIQWQPGAGHERINQWYDLIKRILSKGKSVQVYTHTNEINDLVKNVGAKGLLVICTNNENNAIQELMKKYK